VRAWGSRLASNNLLVAGKVPPVWVGRVCVKVGRLASAGHRCAKAVYAALAPSLKILRLAVCSVA
jgi:hypothetical protein